MPEEKPLPPEFEPEDNPESQDDSTLDEAPLNTTNTSTDATEPVDSASVEARTSSDEETPGAEATGSLENPVVPTDIPDIHDQRKNSGYQL